MCSEKTFSRSKIVTYAAAAENISNRRYERTPDVGFQRVHIDVCPQLTQAKISSDVLPIYHCFIIDLQAAAHDTMLSMSCYMRCAQLGNCETHCLVQAWKCEGGKATNVSLTDHAEKPLKPA